MTLHQQCRRRFSKQILDVILKDLVNKSKPELIAVYMAHDAAAREDKGIDGFLHTTICGAAYAVLMDVHHYDPTKPVTPTPTSTPEVA